MKEVKAVVMGKLKIEYKDCQNYYLFRYFWTMGLPTQRSIFIIFLLISPFQGKRRRLSPCFQKMGLSIY